MAAPIYPRIPDLPVPSPAETVHQYGLRLFAYVLAEDTVGAMADDAVELALHASTAILSGTYDDSVRAHITAARRYLADTIERRRKAAAAPPAGPAGGLTPDRPNLGPMAPLIDAPIARPPSGAALRAADLERELRDLGRDRWDIGAAPIDLETAAAPFERPGSKVRADFDF